MRYCIGGRGDTQLRLLDGSGVTGVAVVPAALLRLGVHLTGHDSFGVVGVIAFVDQTLIGHVWPRTHSAATVICRRRRLTALRLRGVPTLWLTVWPNNSWPSVEIGAGWRLPAARWITALLLAASVRKLATGLVSPLWLASRWIPALLATTVGRLAKWAAASLWLAKWATLWPTVASPRFLSPVSHVNHAGAVIWINLPLYRQHGRKLIGL